MYDRLDDDPNMSRHVHVSNTETRQGIMCVDRLQSIRNTNQNVGENLAIFMDLKKAFNSVKMNTVPSLIRRAEM